MLRHVLPYADIALTSCPLRHLVKDDTNLAYTKGSEGHGVRAVNGIRATPDPSTVELTTARYPGVMDKSSPPCDYMPAL